MQFEMAFALSDAAQQKLAQKNGSEQGCNRASNGMEATSLCARVPISAPSCHRCTEKLARDICASAFRQAAWERSTGAEPRASIPGSTSHHHFTHPHDLTLSATTSRTHITSHHRLQVQSLVRAFQARKQYSKARTAAVIIQAMARRVACRVARRVAEASDAQAEPTPTAASPSNSTRCHHRCRQGRELQQQITRLQVQQTLMCETLETLVFEVRQLQKVRQCAPVTTAVPTAAPATTAAEATTAVPPAPAHALTAPSIISPRLLRHFVKLHASAKQVQSLVRAFHARPHSTTLHTHMTSPSPPPPHTLT